jgi:glycine/serine hydroxymethyltransferase
MFEDLKEIICEYVDVAEQIAIDRLKKLFGAEAANVQANSGSQANQAVLMAFAKPGDTIMGMSLAEGGHLTHGMALNMSGKWFNVVSYGLNEKEEIDYDKMEATARECRPKLIIGGASAYSREWDYERMRAMGTNYTEGTSPTGYPTKKFLNDEWWVAVRIYCTAIIKYNSLNIFQCIHYLTY